MPLNDLHSKLIVFTDSLHARLNSHNKAWSYKRGTKRLKDTGDLLRKNPQSIGVF